MAALAKLVRRFPPDELGKPPGKRTKWFWILRWTTTDGDRGQAESIGYWSKDPTWRPARGARVRMNRADAEKLLRSKLVECDKGKQDKPPSTPWDEWVESYLSAIRDTVAPRTHSLIAESLEVFSATCRPDSPASVTKAMVRRFVAVQRRVIGASGKRRSDGTISKHLSYLRRVWNDVDELTALNPFTTKNNRFLKQIRAPVKEWHRYTPSEIRDLLDSVPDDRWAARIVVAYFAGLRKAEVLNLTWADIDFARKRICVNSKCDTDDTWEWRPKDKE